MLDGARLDRLGQGQGHGARAGVGHAIDVDDHLLHGNAHALGGGFHDAVVRLVQDEVVDLVHGDAGALGDLLDALGDDLDGELVGLAAVHVDRVLHGLDHLDRRRHPRAQGDLDVGRAPAVRAHVAAEQALLLAAAQHDRAAGVAEEDGGAAVLPVDVLGEQVAADDERRAVHAGGEELAGDDGPVDEAAAGGLHVEGGGGGGADGVLDQGGRGGHGHVRGRGRDDDEIQLGGLDPGVLERLLGGGDGHVAHGVLGRRDAALTDARAFTDPGVVGVEEGLELGVGHDPLGDVITAADDGNGEQGSGHGALSQNRPDWRVQYLMTRRHRKGGR
ncbi:hypothetical protein D3C86_1252670 [compost metagenome]